MTQRHHKHTQLDSRHMFLYCSPAMSVTMPLSRPRYTAPAPAMVRPSCGLSTAAVRNAFRCEPSVNFGGGVTIVRKAFRCEPCVNFGDSSDRGSCHLSHCNSVRNRLTQPRACVPVRLQRHRKWQECCGACEESGTIRSFSAGRQLR
jgi:hypothetical protein